jgi:selenocysteine lyase/cysteine desulfurase
MTGKFDTNGLVGGALLRGHMPVVERLAYFDNAAVAPLPEPTRQVIESYAQQAAFEGDTRWPEWALGVETARRRAAELLSCNTTEIALVPNTTFGINLVANGLRWSAGENVVVPANEFPSNLLPWRLLERRGVEVRLIEGNDDELVRRMIESIDRRTRLVSISWVHYSTGYRADLAAICEQVHARGALFFVDAIQGLGAFPLSLNEIPIDFLAADGHKWMLGPEGAGLFFVRQSKLEQLDPIMIGWSSVENPHHYDPTSLAIKPTAARYEGGSTNMAGMLGLSESLRLLLDAGCHDPHGSIEATILELTERLASGLQSLNAEVNRHPKRNHQSGIVSFRFPGTESSSIRSDLLREQIVVSVRHGFLRAAIHAYNDKAEIDRLLETLKNIL